MSDDADNYRKIVPYVAKRSGMEIMFEPHLYEKVKRKDNRGADTEKEQWEMTVVMPVEHPDLKPMKQICIDLFTTAIAHPKFLAENPDYEGFVMTPKNWNYPWQTGEDYIADQLRKGKDKYDNSNLKGKVLFKSHSLKFPPRLSNLVPGAGIVDAISDAEREALRGKFFMGAEVFVEYGFQFYAVGSSKPGVTAYLNHVVATGQGEKRGGGKPGAEKFDGYEGKKTNVDPTAAAALSVDDY